MNTIIKIIKQQIEPKEVGYETYQISSTFTIRLTDTKIMQVKDERLDNFKAKISRLLQDKYNTHIGNILNITYDFPMSTTYRNKAYNIVLNNEDGKYALSVETVNGSPIYSKDTTASVLFSWLQDCGVEFATKEDNYYKDQIYYPIDDSRKVKEKINNECGIKSKPDTVKHEIPIKQYADNETLNKLKQLDENLYICVDGNGDITVIDCLPKWSESMQEWFINDWSKNHYFKNLNKSEYKGLYMTSDDGTMTLKELINATEKYNKHDVNVNVKNDCKVNVGEQYSLEDYEGVMPTENKKECESECVKKQTEDAHIKLDAGKKIIIELGPVKITIE